MNEGGADLEAAAKAIVDQAFEAGSEDNLTVQIVRVDEVPDGAAGEVFAQPHELPLPPLLEARAVFDGYRIVRELHGSSRSHIYLRRRYRNRRAWSPSRFRRSICATIPPT